MTKLIFIIAPLDMNSMAKNSIKSIVFIVTCVAVQVTESIAKGVFSRLSVYHRATGGRGYETEINSEQEQNLLWLPCELKKKNKQ